MNPTSPRVEMRKINATAGPSYITQAGGSGAGDDALRMLEDHTPLRLGDDHSAIEIGAGMGELAKHCLLQRHCKMFYAVDIIPRLHEELSDIEHDPTWGPRLKIYVQDVSHVGLPMDADKVDAAFCTETIEHLANPFHMVAEVKRVLKHDGYFVIAFPMPEDNLGYGNGEHAHIYPGFLERASFERFMMQAFFRQVSRVLRGATAWYVFQNYKTEGLLDVFELVAGNYDGDTLYEMLSPNIGGSNDVKSVEGVLTGQSHELILRNKSGEDERVVQRLEYKKTPDGMTLYITAEGTSDPRYSIAMKEHG